jgi:diaminopimelate dehydrogenase
MAGKAKPLRLAIVGVGKLGRACVEAIRLTHDLVVAAFVRRPTSRLEGLPHDLQHIPVVARLGETKDIDGALICVPTNAVLETAAYILAHGTPIVECATLHGEAFHTHKEALRRLAVRHQTSAIVGAGWDPGALSAFRMWLALLTPGGITETTHRPGVSLHHMAMVQGVVGVKDALCTERRAPDGKVHRYVYVELETGAHADDVANAIRRDPLFLGEETQVFPVESLASLEEEGRGVVLDRRGSAGRLGHQHFVLEGRFDETVMTAQVMVASTRALPALQPGAYHLGEIPVNALWGEQAEKAERDWL